MQMRYSEVEKKKKKMKMKMKLWFPGQ